MLGVENMSDAAMSQFLSFSGNGLYLRNLESLSEKSAEVLAQLPCSVSLDGLKTLPESVARILVQNKHSLSFNGLQELSEATAKILSNYEGESLQLRGIKHMSDEVARTLVKYEGDLRSLSAVPIPKSAASILKEHPTVFRP